MGQEWIEVLRRYQLPQQNIEVVILISGILLAILIAIIFFQYRSYINSKKRRHEKNWHIFHTACKSKELSDYEINIIKEIIKLTHVYPPILILTIREKFEKVVDIYLKENNKQVLGEIEYNNLIDNLMKIRQKLKFLYTPADMPLISTRQIVTNQKFRLEIIDSIAGREIYRTVLIDLDDGKLLISTPLSLKNKPFEYIGKKVKMYFWRENDAGYEFETKIIGYKEPPLNAFELGHSHNLVRNQVRNYFRVKTRINIYLNIFSRTDDKVSKIKGLIIDISGGGAKIVFEEEIKKDEILIFDLPLDNEVVRNTKIKLIGVADRVVGKKILRIARGEFIGIEEEDREKIIKYTYRKKI